MNAVDPPDKFHRYRERQRARGLRELRRWVYDLNAPGLRAKLAEEIARINAADDAADVGRFLEAVWVDQEDSIRATESGSP